MKMKKGICEICGREAEGYEVTEKCIAVTKFVCLKCCKKCIWHEIDKDCRKEDEVNEE